MFHSSLFFVSCHFIIIRNLDYNCIECQTVSGLTCNDVNQNRCPGLICHHKNYINHCATCDTPEYDGVCTSCHRGYYPDSSKTSCVDCPDGSCCYEGNWDDALENCKECDNDGKCHLCDIGFYIGNDGKCVECGEHTCCSGRNTEPESFNCSNCNADGTECLKCDPDVVFYQGKCYDGPIHGIDNETGDIVSIRSALFYLCRENADNEFGSCCVNNDYGALVTFDNYPSCFGSVNVDSDGKITLFVINLISFFIIILLIGTGITLVLNLFQMLHSL